MRSKADSSAVVKFAWDRKYLYLAAAVADDSLKPLAKKTDMPWSCDSLILVTSVFGATQGSPRYRQHKNVETSNEPFFGFSYYTADTGARQWTKNSSYIARKTTTGYNVEAAIALADIGYQPAAGDRIKMAFILSDLDADGKWSQLTLGFPQRFVSNATNFWLDLRFRDATPWAGEIVTAESKLAPGASLQFMGDVDAFSGKPLLRGVVVQDQSGKTVATVPADAALPPRRDHTVCGQGGRGRAAARNLSGRRGGGGGRQDPNRRRLRALRDSAQRGIGAGRGRQAARPLYRPRPLPQRLPLQPHRLLPDDHY